MRRLLQKAIYPFYIILLISVFYGLVTIYRSHELYTYVKSSPTELLTSGILDYNPSLGYSAQPESSGQMQFLLPPNIPVDYDARMFRVVPGYTADADSPLMLFLGCSWTHGDATRAEETFAHRVGSHMHARYFNAGYHAYGLSQMLLRAREVIKTDRPDYVLVQYSPWLVDRSMRHFAGGRFLQRPIPYFTKTQEGKLEIASPAFQVRHSPPIGSYRGYPKSLKDFASFMLDAALPFNLHQDLNLVSFNIRRLFGLIPDPHDDRLEIVRYVYGEIESLCRLSGCKMLIYQLDRPSRTPGKPSRNSHFAEEEAQYLKSLSGWVYADSYSALLEPLEIPDDASFVQEYAHYRGEPPRVVDRHPNARAHAIIAASIIEALEK